MGLHAERRARRCRIRRGARDRTERVEIGGVPIVDRQGV